MGLVENFKNASVLKKLGPEALNLLMDIVSNIVEGMAETAIDIDDFLTAIFTITEVQKKNEITPDEKSILEKFLSELQDTINNIGK